MKIENITQPIAFLNGTNGLNGPEEELFRKLSKKGIKPLIIDELYSRHENLLVLKNKKVKTLVVQTTGQNFQDIFRIVEFFKSMSFVPENIVLIFPDKLYPLVKDFVTANPTVMVYEWFNSDTFSVFEF